MLSLTQQTGIMFTSLIVQIRLEGSVEGGYSVRVYIPHSSDKTSLVLWAFWNSSNPFTSLIVQIRLPDESACPSRRSQFTSLIVQIRLQRLDIKIFLVFSLHPS